MLRKSLALFSLLILFLTLLSGCSDSSSPAFRSLDRWMHENGKLKVLSTTAMIDDLVREIVGDRIDHITLIHGDIDPHSYELIKGDEEKFSLSDVVFYNGFGLEHGASLAYRLKMHPSAYSLGNRILKSHPEMILEDRGQIDPHIWMDISLWIVAAREVAVVLSEKDPEGADVYKERVEALFARMQAAHEEIVEMMQQIPDEDRYFVASHDAFFYFARAYLARSDEREKGTWRTRFSAPEGLAPNGQLSPTHLKEVITFLKKNRVHCVFPESNVSCDSLKKITSSCKALGHKIRLSKEILYGDAMGPAGSNADTYLKMIQHNAQVLKKELECRK